MKYNLYVTKFFYFLMVSVLREERSSWALDSRGVPELFLNNVLYFIFIFFALDYLNLIIFFR